MSTWEYRKTDDFTTLDELGRAGWELVSAVPSGTPGGATFYLKRAAHDFRERVTLDQKHHYYTLMGISPHEEQHTK